MAAALGRDYQRLWTASAISNLGDGVLLTALPLLAASLSGEPLAVSAVTVALTAPWLLFALVSGVLVDRWDRLALMARVDLARGVLTVLLAATVLLGATTVPLLLVLAFLLGSAETLFDTAALATVPSLVGSSQDQLHRANARLEGARIVATQFVGPPLGGALFAAIPAAPVIADAASFFASAELLRSIRGNRTPARSHRNSTFRSEIIDGLRWLIAAPLLRLLAVMVGVMNFGFAASTSVLVLLLRGEAGTGPLGYGIVLSVGALGAIAGNVFADRYGTQLKLARSLVLSVAGSGAALIAIGTAPSAPVVGIALAIGGFAGALWNVLTVSYRQSIIPTDLLGRVNSVYRLVAYGALPLGAATGGVLATYAGLRAPYLASGTLILVASAALACSRSLRTADDIEPSG
jgi:MFS family permease